MTVTVVSLRGAGHVTVFGHNLPRPATSNLNFAAHRTVANLVVAVPGADGKVDLTNASTAGAHFLVDISGYYRTGQAAQPGGYSPVSPARVLDTRSGLGGTKAQVDGGSSRTVGVTGRAGVPHSGVAAIVMTVTVVRPRAGGHLTVFGHNLPRPATSNLNFAADRTVANLVVAVPGTDGKVDLTNASSAGTHLLVDISGYYVAPDQFASSQGGAGRTFNNPSETALTAANVAGLQPAWNANHMAVGSEGSPALVDGTAYIPGRDPGQPGGMLLAANAQTGQTLWTALMPDCQHPMDGLTVSGGMAFIGCTWSNKGTSPRGGVVVAVSLSSHQQAWSRRVTFSQTSEISAADGMLFTIEDDGRTLSLLALDARTGQIRFRITPPSRMGMTYAAKNGQLVVSTPWTYSPSSLLPASLKVYNDATGALLWSAIGDDVFGALTIDAGHILLFGPPASKNGLKRGAANPTAPSAGAPPLPSATMHDRVPRRWRWAEQTDTPWLSPSSATQAQYVAASCLWTNPRARS